MQKSATSLATELAGFFSPQTYIVCTYKKIDPGGGISRIEVLYLTKTTLNQTIKTYENQY